MLFTSEKPVVSWATSPKRTSRPSVEPSSFVGENEMTDQILTTTEIAVELRCSKAQVYRLLNGAVKDVPQLPYISLGRKKVVRRSALEDWKRLNEGCILSGDA